jgi:hypothetical protein
MAGLAVFFVVVTVNSFLYFGYYAPAVPPAPSTEPTPLAEEGTSPSTVPEPTGGQEEEGQEEEGQEEEGQRLRETTGETAVPIRGAATAASPSASASPSPP